MRKTLICMLAVMRKTLICMLAVLMLLSSVLVACGEGEGGSETKPGESTLQPESGKNPGGNTSKSGGNSTESPACEHEAVTDAAVEATCTVDGKTEGSHCAKCGEVLVAQEVIPAGHNFVDGKCTRCGMRISLGLEYSLNNDGASYSVTGIGNCTDTDLVIPPTHPDDRKPVTSIGYQAFYECKGLTSVTIGNGVTSIGREAFYNCTGLTSVTIPDSVISIGGYAFYSTAYYDDESNWENDVLYIGNWLIQAKESLSGSYSIKDGTGCIAGGAFICCSGLTSVTIPNSVTSIGEDAFCGCSGLTSFTIPDSVTSIGREAFYKCSGLISVTIGNGVKSIGSSAFCDCEGLTSVTIPDSVTSIGDYAFSYCNRLTSITIPDSVISIGYQAFYECKRLNSVTIGNSVTSIEDEAFYYCSDLTSITYKGTVTQWKTIYKGSGWGNFTVYCTDGEISKADA